MFTKLKKIGWDVSDENHGLLIAESLFQEEFTRLENRLVDFEIPITDLIRSGGGKAEPTKRLEIICNSFGWIKNNVENQTKITFSDARLEPKVVEALSHEIDHVGFDPDKLNKFALEIEWSNKQQFFDRDIQAMKGLHEMGAIELGVIILRGSNFNEKIEENVSSYFQKHIKNFSSFKLVKEEIESIGGTFTFPTDKQAKSIEEKTKKLKNYALSASNVFIENKYGSSGTTWKKLQDKIKRGHSGRTPMVILGIPGEIISS